MSINVRFETPRSLTEGDEPTPGVLEEGELFTNLFDQRIWVYDQNKNPAELGGSVKSFPIGLNHNYQVFDMTDYWDVNSLLEIPDPSQVLNSKTYTEHYLFLNNVDEISPTLVTNILKIKFLYPVRWPTQYLLSTNLGLVNDVDTGDASGTENDIVQSLVAGEFRSANGFYTGGITLFNNSTGEIEIDLSKSLLAPTSILIKLFTFGPSSFWRGIIQGEWIDED